MAKISAITFPMILVTMLVSLSLAQLLPDVPVLQIPGLLPPVPGAEKCWSSLSNIPNCHWEISSSVSIGKVTNIGSACCNAIVKIPENCWHKMLPFHPLLPPLLKSFCAAPSPYQSSSSNNNNNNKLSVALAAVNVTEIKECWSSISNTNGCVAEVFKSLSGGQITGSVAPACCKAVVDINDKCWPKMFPFNPFFPPLLKSTCVKIIGAPK